MFFENFFNKNKYKCYLPKSVMSERMKDAVVLWSNIYQNHAPWLSENTHSLNLAASICSEIARLTTIELRISVTGSERADFLSNAVNLIMPHIRQQFEYACAKGGLIMKPYVSENNILVDFIQPDAFIPTAVSERGTITSAVFIQTAQQNYTHNHNGRFLTRLEEHSLENGIYTIQNTAFISNDPYNLGKEISLEESGIWSGLSGSVTLENMQHPLFVYLKMPCANNIDSTSPFGVSVFSRAADLIKEADRQYSRLLWEFQSGERALYLDETAFRRDKNGKPVLPDKRLYKTINSGENELFHDWSPVMRDESILRGLDSILSKIEDMCGLSRGTFSKTDSQAKTATELKILRQRSYSTIADMQKCLQNALEELLSVMNIWCELSGIGGQGKYSAAFEFDDSIICDTETEFKQKLSLVNAGIMSKDEFRAWYFGENRSEEIPS